MSCRDQQQPVAIVGLGCRWPGDVRTAPQLWEFLRNKQDGWRMFGEPRFSAKAFHHPNSDRPGTVAMKGAFLTDQDARLFDHAFFGLSSLEVETLDPSQRKLLEVTYEAFENAGDTWDTVSGSRTGVFVGNFCLDHWMIQSRDWDYPRPYAFTGAGTSILANRISYVFNLKGPSLTVDTACSSSMYALHLAVNSIRSGDCDAAVVASANWIADPGVQIVLDKLGALSASSRCHTFDSKANGYARGEGFAAIYLKKTSLTLAIGSPIRAVIRGTAINANGRTGGITRPSALTQEAVIRDAYRNAGNLPFSETDYFECHGTGTYVGDPIEVAAVGQVFASGRSKSNPLLVGSVKSNLGHTEGSSALASIMKVVLSLEAGVIPPIFKIETLNPNIDFEKARIKIVREMTPWPRNNLRRASINSFGYGGANGHCIIDHVNNLLPLYLKPGVYLALSNTAIPGRSIQENANGIDGGYTNSHHGKGETPSHTPIKDAIVMKRTYDASTRHFVLLPFSAHNETSLNLNVDALSEVISQFKLADVAYTLGSKRSELSHRSYCIVDKDNVASGLHIERAIIRSPLMRGNIGFVFTGQGAQWHAMGSQLFGYRIFRKTIEYLDRILGVLTTPPTWMLCDILSGNCGVELIETPEVSQTACTAVQVGLTDLLASWSVRPSGVVGHSSGEIAAAYASGRITAGEAIVTAYFRGRAVAKDKRNGAMLAVGLGLDQIHKHLHGREEHVKVAAINSPGSITVSGDEEAVGRLSAALDDAGIFNRALRTGGNAYHSHHMIPLGCDYSEMLIHGLAQIEELGLVDNKDRYSLIPWLSSVAPDKQHRDITDLPSYWKANLESPVRFSDAISNLVNLNDTPISVLVEVGPHPALKSPLDQILKSVGKSSIKYASTLTRQQGNQESMLHLAGLLFSLNTGINVVATNATDDDTGTGLEHGCTAIDLPPYQYTYGPAVYHESRLSREYRYRNVPRHDLLGSKVVGTAKLRPQWRNILRPKDLPWLGEHRLIPDVIFPASAYLVLAIEAAGRVYFEFPDAADITAFEIRDVAIKAALKIPEDEYGVEIVFSMEVDDTATADTPMWSAFSVSSVGRDSDEWLEHCTGFVKVNVSKAEIPDTTKTLDEQNVRMVDARAWYRKFTALGLGYGPTFQTLSEIRASPDGSLVTAKLSLDTTANTVKGGESGYSLHPAALDGTFQLGIIACNSGQIDMADGGFVPIQLSELYLKSDVGSQWGTVLSQGEKRGLRGAYADLKLRNAAGETVMNVVGLRYINYMNENKPPGQAFNSPFTRLVWKPDIRTLTRRQCAALFPPPKESVKNSPLFDIMDRITKFIVIDVYETFGKIVNQPKPSGNVGHFFSWVKRRAEEDSTEVMKGAREFSRQQRLAAIDQLYLEAHHVPEIRIAKLLHENMADILYERREGVDLLVQEDVLTPLYERGLLMTSAYPQLYSLLDSLGHANPSLKYLEIGGGTGGATRVAMKALGGPNGIKRYREYTFTDVSPGFLGTARENFSQSRDMTYSVLDIELDPQEQGYQPEYDVVIASQVLHATRSIAGTLANCRKLLKPGGRLVLVESTQALVIAGLVLGTLTGFWHGIPDGRVESPLLSIDSWDSALQRAGFSGTELVLDDFSRPKSVTSTILSTVIGSTATIQMETEHAKYADHISPMVQVLYGPKVMSPLIGQVTQELDRNGVQTNARPLDEVLDGVSSNTHAVVFLDANYITLIGTDENILETFQHLARNTASLVCLTSCGLAKGRNPDGALIPGLLRVLGTENPAGHFVSIDIDSDNFEVSQEDSESLVRYIVDHELELIRSREIGGDESMPRDCEFVWQGSCMWVSRFVPDAYLQSQYRVGDRAVKTGLQPLGDQHAMCAAFETPGALSTLYFAPYKELLQPLPSDCIDVQVTSVGLNAKDLDVWAGRSDFNYLSSEYSGVVTATGANVHDVEVGDRVYGVGKGQFGNYTRVPAALAHKLQPNDEHMDMATMPLAFTSAIYLFDYITHLRRGQTVLIQSASDDLGLAALQLAQAKGAVVFAMADTQEHADFLVEELNLPSSHVCLSNDVLGLDRVKDMTSNGAFNIVLSDARRGIIRESPNIIAPLGHLIVVNQAEAQNNQARGFYRRGVNVSFFDSSLILDCDPALGGELMRAVDNYYRQGLIKPLRPVTITDVGRLPEVLSATPKEIEIGKLVVVFATERSLVRMVLPTPVARFDPEACYVITGGLGGLGRSILRWMSDRGARYLVNLSRRAADDVPGARGLIDDLAGRGIQVQSVMCDVSDREQVIRVIQEISCVRPLKGVVHAAVSYQDLSFDKLSTLQWQQSLSAKVHGTKNLHEATLSMPLDFFVMTTSLLSVYALATQTAYTAANNFQDAFARYRRRLGLPASTVSFSLINDIGDPSKNLTTIDAFARNKTLTLSEHQFLALLEPAFLNNGSGDEIVDTYLGQQQDPLSIANLITCLNPAVMAVKQGEEADAKAGPTATLPRWYNDGRVSLIMRAFSDAQHQSETPQSTSDMSAKSTVTQLRHKFNVNIQKGVEGCNSTTAFVEDAIKTTVAEVLFVDVEGVSPTKSVADHGVDSLVAAELRNWFNQALGVNISMLDLLDQRTTISALAMKIVNDALAAT